MNDRLKDLRYWLQENLFFSYKNSILSVIAGLFLLWLIVQLVNWFFLQAVWIGTIEDCRIHQEGACWPFVHVRASQFLYGFYPSDERWRVNLILFVFFAGIGLLVY